MIQIQKNHSKLTLLPQPQLTSQQSPAAPTASAVGLDPLDDSQQSPAAPTASAVGIDPLDDSQ